MSDGLAFGPNPATVLLNARQKTKERDIAATMLETMEASRRNKLLDKQIEQGEAQARRDERRLDLTAEQIKSQEADRKIKREQLKITADVARRQNEEAQAAIDMGTFYFDTEIMGAYNTQKNGGFWADALMTLDSYQNTMGFKADDKQISNQPSQALQQQASKLRLLRKRPMFQDFEQLMVAELRDNPKAVTYQAAYGANYEHAGDSNMPQSWSWLEARDLARGGDEKMARYLMSKSNSPLKMARWLGFEAIENSATSNAQTTGFIKTPVLPDADLIHPNGVELAKAGTTRANEIRTARQQASQNVHGISDASVHLASNDEIREQVLTKQDRINQRIDAGESRIQAIAAIQEIDAFQIATGRYKGQLEGTGIYTSEEIEDRMQLVRNSMRLDYDQSAELAQKQLDYQETIEQGAREKEQEALDPNSVRAFIANVPIQEMVNTPVLDESLVAKMISGLAKSEGMLWKAELEKMQERGRKPGQKEYDKAVWGWNENKAFHGMVHYTSADPMHDHFSDGIKASGFNRIGRDSFYSNKMLVESRRKRAEILKLAETLMTKASPYYAAGFSEREADAYIAQAEFAREVMKMFPLTAKNEDETEAVVRLQEYDAVIDARQQRNAARGLNTPVDPADEFRALLGGARRELRAAGGPFSGVKNYSSPEEARQDPTLSPGDTITINGAPIVLTQ